MIYSINAKDNVMYPVIKSYFNLSDKEIYSMINNDFNRLQKRLKIKNIDYHNLKRALIPNQEKNKNELCLVFDTLKIDTDNYGYYVFDKLIPLLDKKSTYIIMVGDYIDTIYRQIPNSQFSLNEILNKEIIKCNSSSYNHSSQYFLIYFNSISNSEVEKIVNQLKTYNWFYGYLLLNHLSKFKIYIFSTLMHLCIKSKSTIIGAHPADCEDIENYNESGYPFEKNGYNVVSINDDSFGTFLSYKIESIYPDKEDIGFSFNAIFPKFNSIDKLKFNISDAKGNILILEQLERTAYYEQ